jgi:fumarate reductase (CoM/CoB) subunit B
VECDIFRHNPGSGGEVRYDSYTVETEPNNTVLGLLQKIHHELDSTLSFRFACGVIKCGECSVLVNGEPCLACERLMEPKMKIDPLPNLPIIKDLVVNRKEVFDRICKIVPALNRGEKGRTDFNIDKADTFVRLTTCFECLICQSACPVYEDPKENFVGPLGLLWVAQNAALADQESRMDQTEIDNLLKKCLQCGLCSDVCPCSEDILTLAYDFLEKSAILS